MSNVWRSGRGTFVFGFSSFLFLSFLSPECLEKWTGDFCFWFLFVSFLVFSFSRSVSFLVTLGLVFFGYAYACTMDGYVHGTISLQVIWDGMPQLISTVPLHVLFCFLPTRRFL